MHNKIQTKEVDRTHSGGESLLKTVIERKMLGKRGRPRHRMLDWMTVEGYRKLKGAAQQQEEWQCQTLNLPRRQRTRRRHRRQS